MAEELLSASGLAERLGRSKSYVIAMRRCGFTFSRQTTLSAALAWLEDHPNPCAEMRKRKAKR